jgi:DNA-binding XRE family transcriptional regulator
MARKMSQTAFAELFGLKRTTLGAYEEERAEADFDTLIAISDYFRLSADSLLKKELTVNEIFHFDSNLMFLSEE